MKMQVYIKDGIIIKNRFGDVNIKVGVNKIIDIVNTDEGLIAVEDDVLNIYIGGKRVDEEYNKQIIKC